MKNKWIEKTINYDGSQLKSLFAYLEHGILGDSIVGFEGSCDISFDKMVDGEDLLEQSEIRSGKMLHFIVEIFDEKLITGVALQRLLTNIVREEILKMKPQLTITRAGDDLFIDNKKLSISIATSSPRSTMIHFGINITNENTPVPTCALSDFGINPNQFGKQILNAFSDEFRSIKEATQKVKWVK